MMETFEKRVLSDADTWPKGGRVITLFSVGGGVGKTTIAVNLAAALCQLQGEKSCVLDADLQFGDVCRYLNLSPAHTLADYAQLGLSTSPSVQPFLTGWLKNLGILAAPLQLDQVAQVTPEILDTVIKELRHQYDYIVVDTTSGFSDGALVALESADLVLFVGVLDSIASVKNMKDGLDTLQSLGYDNTKLKLILNRNKAKTTINYREVEKLLGCQFAALLANDFSTASIAIQNGMPFVLGQSDKELAREITSLAKAVAAGTLGNQPPKQSLVERLGGWLGVRRVTEPRTLQP